MRWLSELGYAEGRGLGMRVYIIADSVVVADSNPL